VGALGKQVRNSFKPINYVTNNRALQLLHMDIFGPTKTQTIIVDYYTRYMWVFFLAYKHELVSHFSKFVKRIQMKNDIQFLHQNGSWRKIQKSKFHKLL